MATPADSLLKWVATFGSVTRCSSLADFLDGVSFWELLVELAPEHTASVTGVNKTGGAANAHNNLRRCLEVLDTWIEETFATKPELNAVFPVASLGNAEVVRILEIVLVAAVHSSKKDAIVNKIMSMTESEQHHLMTIIEETVGNIGNLAPAASAAADVKGGSSSASAAGSGSPSLSAAHSKEDPLDMNSSHLSMASDFGDDSEKRSQSSQIRQLKLDNAKLHELLDDQSRSARDLKKKFEALKAEMEDSTKSSKEGASAALTAATAAADEKLKAEQSRSARAAKEHELVTADLKRELAAANSALDKSKRKYADDMETAKREAQGLHDELDLLKEKTKKLIAAETQLDRYKKKLESMGEVGAQLRDSEQQRNADLERILTLEAENKRIPTLQTQLNKYKDEVIELKTKLQDATSSDELNKAEAVKWRDAASNAKKEHKLVADALEQAKAELSAKNEANTPAPLKSALSDQLATDLKQRVLKLELENKELRANAGGGNNSDLNDQLEMAQRLHTTTQAKYLDAQKTIRTLTEQLEAANAATASANANAAAASKAAAAGSSSPPPTSSTGSEAQMASLKKELESLRTQLATAKTATPPATASGSTDATAAGGSASSSAAGAGGGNAVLLAQLEKAETYGRAMKLAYEKEHALNAAAALKLKNSERQRTMFAEAIQKLKAGIVERERELKEREKIRLEEKQATKLEQRLLASAFYEIGFDYHSSLLSGRAARKPGGVAPGVAAGGGSAAAAHTHVPTATTANVAAANQPSPTKSFLAKQRNKVNG